MSKKVRTSVLVDEEILKIAKDLGINISKTLELALIREIHFKIGLYGQETLQHAGILKKNTNLSLIGNWDDDSGAP
ncbi:type II toxin-antitoxin system CcdA family antitoxin [Thermococcus thermotolerans]|uniref:type II toxin-antitoxin system CcdA family antitoxin n=1 Tax=Thermococcus thermotolerans TaxID=2969672 RepID=UPI002156F8AA|nr:type II toxin-antitoxin system CcdA family antitoxin [Thermococcus thermotolerans]